MNIIFLFIPLTLTAFSHPNCGHNFSCNPWSKN